MAWTWWVLLGSLLAGSGVGFGAFGAHALKDKLEPYALQVFETAVRYQMYHALALLFVGLLALRLDSWWVKSAGLCLFLGTCLFSGSLYLIVLYAQRQLGIVTPIGGAFLILGWLLLAISVVYVSLAS